MRKPNVVLAVEHNNDPTAYAVTHRGWARACGADMIDGLVNTMPRANFLSVPRAVRHA